MSRTFYCKDCGKPLSGLAEPGESRRCDACRKDWVKFRCAVGTGFFRLERESDAEEADSSAYVMFDTLDEAIRDAERIIDAEEATLP